MARESLKQLTDLPNICKSMERDFHQIGVHHPADLIGQYPYQHYRHLCDVTQVRHDPCVLDTFISVVRFMEGGPPKK